MCGSLLKYRLVIVETLLFHGATYTKVCRYLRLTTLTQAPFSELGTVAGDDLTSDCYRPDRQLIAYTAVGVCSVPRLAAHVSGPCDIMASMITPTATH
jgi:hypothetical protein